jgi:hypothetical protein
VFSESDCREETSEHILVFHKSKHASDILCFKYWPTEGIQGSEGKYTPCEVFEIYLMSLCLFFFAYLTTL